MHQMSHSTSLMRSGPGGWDYLLLRLYEPDGLQDTRNPHSDTYRLHHVSKVSSNRDSRSCNNDGPTLEPRLEKYSSTRKLSRIVFQQRMSRVIVNAGFQVERTTGHISALKHEPRKRTILAIFDFLIKTWYRQTWCGSMKRFFLRD